MKLVLDESKELDHFNFRANKIFIIMNKLTNSQIKNSFL